LHNQTPRSGPSADVATGRFAFGANQRVVPADKGGAKPMTNSEVSVDGEIENLVEPPTGVALFALRKGQCKYPLGGMFEPASQFCGCDAPIGSPYCTTHRAVAYRNWPQPSPSAPPWNQPA